MANETFKNKVGSLKGGVAALKAAGFEVVEGEEALMLAPDADIDRLNMVAEKLKKAEPRFA